MNADLDESTFRAIAQEVAALLERRDATPPLLTAGQVASRFNVERGWVYAHAQELGVVRLTSSNRSRLRFDPAVVAQRLLAEQREITRVPVPRGGRRSASVSLLPVHPA